MRREEAEAYRAMIENAASYLDDETALESIALFPQWKTMTGYKSGDRCRYNDVLYRCVQTHASQDDWTPDVTPALWIVVSIEEWPEWVQPTGAHDAYNTGDKVSHNDKHWECTIDNNVYEPGVYGWNEV